MKSPLGKLLVTGYILLLTSSPAMAKIRLVEWHTKNAQAPIIIPVREGETPEEASNRYLKGLSQSTDLMELFQGNVPPFETVKYQELNPSEADSRALLIANLPKDLTTQKSRAWNFRYYLGKQNQKSYILPMVANLGLTLKETRELFNEIADKFPLLVAMGGEDVDPQMYKSENFHAKNTVLARDQFEIALIKSYVTAEKGFLLGVCRGSQITSVALGYKLIQDIPFHVPDNVQHSETWHDVGLLKTTNGILKSVSPNADRIHVNSLHHQSVIFRPDGPLELAARGDDGITEATEFKNGHGLLLQFHPELMNNSLGYQILGAVVKAKNRAWPRQCSRIFGN